MPKLTIVTTTVRGDEKAWGLFEIHEQSPNHKGFHRYQIIQVMRDDKVAEWRKDMGLAKNFKKARQIRIPSFNEHTVDELMALADNLRYEQTKDEFDVREILGVYPFTEKDSWQAKHSK